MIKSSRTADKIPCHCVICFILWCAEVWALFLYMLSTPSYRGSEVIGQLAATNMVGESLSEQTQKTIPCNFHVSFSSSVLLLAPLLAEADPAPRRVSKPTGSAGAQRTGNLSSHFRWIAEHVPAFRVPGTHVHILSSPDQFYQTMKVSVMIKIKCHTKQREKQI